MTPTLAALLLSFIAAAPAAGAGRPGLAARHRAEQAAPVHRRAAQAPERSGEAALAGARLRRA